MINPPRLDAHAHVWDRTCTMVDGARYHPDYEATVSDYLALLDAHGIERAVLVQPSFLGTDNRYMMAACAAHPDRLSAIVVVAPGTSDVALQDLAAGGAIGLRYNMVGRDPALLQTPAWRDLTQRATALGWWIEVQSPGPTWPTILSAFEDIAPRIMVDHFGLPSGPDCPGIQALSALDETQVALKLSAPYRQSTPHCLEAVQPWLEGPNKPTLLWGSDWPWTQHEDQHGYADCITWLHDWTTDNQRTEICANPPLGDATAHGAPRVP